MHLPGWGFQNAGGSQSEQLRVLKTKTISNEQCGNFDQVTNLPETKLCTYSGTGQGICQGDAG